MALFDFRRRGFDRVIVMSTQCFQNERASALGFLSGAAAVPRPTGAAPANANNVASVFDPNSGQIIAKFVSNSIINMSSPALNGYTLQITSAGGAALGIKSTGIAVAIPTGSKQIILPISGQAVTIPTGNLQGLTIPSSPTMTLQWSGGPYWFLNAAQGAEIEQAILLGTINSPNITTPVVPITQVIPQPPIQSIPIQPPVVMVPVTPAPVVSTVPDVAVHTVTTQPVTNSNDAPVTTTAVSTPTTTQTATGNTASNPVAAAPSTGVTVVPPATSNTPGGSGSVPTQSVAVVAAYTINGTPLSALSQVPLGYVALGYSTSGIPVYGPAGAPKGTYNLNTGAITDSAGNLLGIVNPNGLPYIGYDNLDNPIMTIPSGQVVIGMAPNGLPVFGVASATAQTSSSGGTGGGGSAPADSGTTTPSDVAPTAGGGQVSSSGSILMPLLIGGGLLLLLSGKKRG